ncbi:DUF3892 domain-containing protein [Domibacillus indicus]|uniref:DUF3892 domain-containing protein n=1 Tax=Domibacillus TaxID=1433999 RepID=UPI001F592813|nr:MULTISPECIES: DUF3892 domain-containing protein [Domibacillus]MCI2257002.1 DUF3892 domain-containing protein [Domibacillus sp. PGB-M46]MCM3790686.1 DUF3892 domain-containing protein [Domibacillus indicus]
MSQDRFEQVYDQYKQQSQQMASQVIQNSSSDGQEQITAVRKNEEGDIIAFKTSSGRELDYMEALKEAKAGRLAHVDVFERYGREIIRSEPDGTKENNLDNLDTF